MDVDAVADKKNNNNNMIVLLFYMVICLEAHFILNKNCQQKPQRICHMPAFSTLSISCFIVIAVVAVKVSANVVISSSIDNNDTE